MMNRLFVPLVALVAPLVSDLATSSSMSYPTNVCSLILLRRSAWHCPTLIP